MEEIQALVKQTNQAMDAFSAASNERMREAQDQARGKPGQFACRGGVCGRAVPGDGGAHRENADRSAEMSVADGMLDACSGRMDAILAQCKSLRGEMEADQPDVKRTYDATQAEQIFSASYTTEMERKVLRAALRGGSLPVVAQHAFEGKASNCSDGSCSRET